MDHGATNGTSARPLSGVRPPVLALEPLIDEDTGSDYDALRDLFLSGSPLGPEGDESCPAAGASEPETAVADVEGLILGHLPVFGPAWAGQYARSLAEEVGGPVGVIGIRAGQTTLDMFGLAGAAMATCETLEDALAEAAPLACRWLIRLDEVNEPEMAESTRVSRVTLLTGADEAAVVACYRTLKRLAPRDEEAVVGPVVRLAIMGSTPEKAGPVAEKLSRAAETFLGRRIEAVTSIGKISPGRSASLFRGATELGLDGVLDLLAAAPRLAPVRAEPVRPRPVAFEPPVVTAQPAIVLPVAPIAPASPIAPVAPVAARVPVAAAVRPAALVGTPSTNTPLHARIGGLQPLVARCPHAPSVELAFDSSGMLHLLVQAGEPGGQTVAEDRALAELTACGSWAASHLPLLALTAPEARLLTTGTRPVLHLATGHAPAVRRLLDTDVRIHLVATVEIDGRTGTVCVALN